MTRRGVLRSLVPAGLVATLLVGCASPTLRSSDGAVAAGRASTGSSASSAPRFAVDGPDAEEYGARDGYPIKANTETLALWQGVVKEFGD